VQIVKGIDLKYKRYSFRRLYYLNVLPFSTLKLTKTYRTKSIACLNAVFINSKAHNTVKYFTFMLPCIVIDFFLNNQPETLIIPILFCYKTPHFSGIFSAHHQEFSTVHSALVSFMQVFDDRFQTESGGNCSSLLSLFGSGHQKPARNLPVPNVQ